MGLEQAGHKCVGFVEIDRHAVNSYRAIFDTGGEFYADDIRTIRAEELPDADCWCGGFPCQSFSIAGKRGGLGDTRGTLIFEVLRLAAIQKPKILFLENVAGLLSHDEGRTFGTILTAMAELGYDVEWQCINSSAYVPQNRDRIFIIGHYGGIAGQQVFPIPKQHGAPLKQIVGGDQASRIYDTSGTSRTLSSVGGGLGAKTGLYLVDLNYGEPKITDNARCIKARYNSGISNRQGENSGILEVCPILTPEKEKVRQNGRRVKVNNEPMFTLTAQDRHGVIVSGVYTQSSEQFTPPPLAGMSRCLKAGSHDAGVIIGSMQKNSAISKNGICPILTGAMGMGGGHIPMHNYGFDIRRLTPRECFRLQGFPDWAFEKAAAVCSDNQLYKQAGNSVTVPVIYEIAKRLKKLYSYS
ncbi:MAG: DNA (cytosine-5-)-methyltransferase [Oscillospiraceae bacterium]|nr:DNA (cytosine-5-)-methyltransferase [Oscillospiraceae bacterium]